MTAEYKSSGVLFLRSKNVRPGYLDLSDVAYIGAEFHTRLRKSQLRPSDIVIVRTGAPGAAALIPEGMGDVNCSDVIIARPGRHVNPRFLCYSINATAGSFVAAHTVGAVQQHFNIGSAKGLRLYVPPLAEQRAIADVLGALDDKIVVNERIAGTSRTLGESSFRSEVAVSGPCLSTIADLTSLLIRGGAPKYVEPPDGMTVINQKCVRYGRVDLIPARRTLVEKVREERTLRHGDVLVNSTRVGTLGRVARWDHAQDATVDSHVTIVRFDAAKVIPVIGAFAMFAAQSRIEALGEGSTGQTELNRAKLGQLALDFPEPKRWPELGDALGKLEATGRARLDENRTLAELRDTLLPKLISGQIRIKDAERAVEEVV